MALGADSEVRILALFPRADLEQVPSPLSPCKVGTFPPGGLLWDKEFPQEGFGTEPGLTLLRRLHHCPQAFTNTYLFYGGYRAAPESSSAYSIRLAYLLSPLACLLLCFCGTLRR